MRKPFATLGSVADRPAVRAAGIAGWVVFESVLLLGGGLVLAAGALVVR